MRSDRYKDEPVVIKKKKKRGPLKGLLILILILAAAIAGSTAYFYKTAYDSLSVTFTGESPVVEFGASCPSMNYVKESSGEIYADSESEARKLAENQIIDPDDYDLEDSGYYEYEIEEIDSEEDDM